MMLEISMPERHHRARLLALSAQHSGDWLQALPHSTFGLRTDDDTVRVAVSLRLGARLGELIISALVAIESNRKALTVSHVDEALAEQLVITPSTTWYTAR
jgi:hypothetical protein